MTFGMDVQYDPTRKGSVYAVAVKIRGECDSINIARARKAFPAKHNTPVWSNAIGKPSQRNNTPCRNPSS